MTSHKAEAFKNEFVLGPECQTGEFYLMEMGDHLKCLSGSNNMECF